MNLPILQRTRKHLRCVNPEFVCWIYPDTYLKVCPHEQTLFFKYIVLFIIYDLLVKVFLNSNYNFLSGPYVDEKITYYNFNDTITVTIDKISRIIILSLS